MVDNYCNVALIVDGNNNVTNGRLFCYSRFRQCFRARGENNFFVDITRILKIGFCISTQWSPGTLGDH